MTAINFEFRYFPGDLTVANGHFDLQSLHPHLNSFSWCLSNKHKYEETTESGHSSDSIQNRKRATKTRVEIVSASNYRTEKYFISAP